ncbi:MAG: LCP family protein [bacterium]|nr:LCP family protein [bacterium]
MKRYFQVLGISLGVLLITAFVAMGIDFSKFTSTQDDIDVDNTSTVAAANGKINVLMMGTDVDGLRTDSIILASFDTETKELKLMNIPRDLKIFVGNRYQKINAAHAYMTDGKIGGPTATVEAVTRFTGIPINYYVDFSFDAVAHVIDELGPVKFTIPDIYNDGVGMVYDDPVQGLHINLPPGEYDLTGQQAVWVMRYRHGNVDPKTNTFKSYPRGDIQRTEMQQELLKAIIDQKLNASLILKIPSIFNDISKEIKTNFTFSDIVKYSKYLSGFSASKIKSVALEGEFETDKSLGDVYIVNLKQVRQLVNDEFGYSADHITLDDPSKEESYNWEKNGKASLSSGSSSSSSGTSTRQHSSEDDIDR